MAVGVAVGRLSESLEAAVEQLAVAQLWWGGRGRKGADGRNTSRKLQMLLNVCSVIRKSTKLHALASRR